MKRRHFLGSWLVPLVATAGCTEQSGTEPAATTAATESATGTDAGTSDADDADGRAVPGWDGTTLSTATLLDAHVRELSTGDSFTADIQATGTQNGDATLHFQLNASQHRGFGTFTASGRPDQDAYFTADQSVIRIEGEETSYDTSGGQTVEDQLEFTAAYQNDDFGLDFAETLQAFEYDYEKQTTFGDDAVFRFTSTSTDLETDAEAVLLVDQRGVVRSAEFTRDGATTTHRFTALGETSVSPPSWLEDVPQSTTTETASEGDEDPAVQDSDLVVDVEAGQWYWQFTYADSGIQNTNQLVVPVDQTVALRVTSSDVRHALSIPDFRTKVDAQPNQTDVARFTPTETGEVSLRCTEYCGEGHADHTGTVVVVSEAEYEAWADSQ